MYHKLLPIMKLEQWLGRLARRGQDQPVIAINIVCDGYYTERSQQIVDKKQASNNAKTGIHTVVTGDRACDVKTVPLEYAVPLVVGLRCLHREGLVYHQQNDAGFALDPDSKSRLCSPVQYEDRGPFNAAQHGKRYWDLIKSAVFVEETRLDKAIAEADSAAIAGPDSAAIAGPDSAAIAEPDSATTAADKRKRLQSDREERAGEPSPSKRVRASPGANPESTDVGGLLQSGAGDLAALRSILGMDKPAD